MSFTIKHGLFRANITDYHAILGVSLDADFKKIRLKYLRIAQKLHPDTCRVANLDDKKFASQLLSRLVNPAYEQLSNKSLFAEHQLILTQLGKRFATKSDRMTLGSESARKLLQAENNLDRVYNQILQELAAEQYQQIDRVLTKIAVISELNLVYLMLTHRRGINREELIVTPKSSISASVKPKAPPKSPARKPPQSQSSTPPHNAPPEEPTPESRAASYIRRAKEYIIKGNYNDAIIELKDALKIDPNNSTAHALMGQAYLRQSQVTMAKVHINKAYKANPKDPVVIESKELLDKLSKKQKLRKTKSSSKNTDQNKSNDSGFFSGFFGSKKK